MLDEIGALKRIQHFVQHWEFHMLDKMLDPFNSVFTVYIENTYNLLDRLKRVQHFAQHAEFSMLH